jgi:hypothetical protein
MTGRRFPSTWTVEKQSACFVGCATTGSAPSDWSVKRRLEYVRRARDVAKGLRGVNQKLEEQFDNAAAAAEQSFKPAI